MISAWRYDIPGSVPAGVFRPARPEEVQRRRAEENINVTSDVQSGRPT